MGQYDEKCTHCLDGVVHDDEGEPCVTCHGYGYLLTSKGDDLIEFLKRRGIHVPMSPLAEDGLSRMIE